MYEKNLTEDLRLRLSADDMNFLRELSENRSSSVSEVIRSIIGEYRRSLSTLDYNRIAAELADITYRYNELIDALNDAGILVGYDKDGNLVIDK